MVHAHAQHAGLRIDEHVRTREYAVRNALAFEEGELPRRLWRITQTLRG